MARYADANKARLAAMPIDQDSAEQYRQQVMLAAKTMVKRYGVRASDEAAIRAKELQASGDFECAEMWRDIANLIHITVMTKLSH